jgi:hypothetical protein
MNNKDLYTYSDINFTHIVFEWCDEPEGFIAFLREDHDLSGYGRSQLEAAVNLVLAYKEASETGVIKPKEHVVENMLYFPPTKG